MQKSGNIAFLSPLGQVVMKARKEKGLSLDGLRRWLKVDKVTLEHILYNPAKTLPKPIRDKVKLKLEVDYLPDYPEDLSLFDSILCLNAEKTDMVFYPRIYSNLRKNPDPIAIQEYTVEVGNALAKHLRRNYPHVMSMEIHSRMTSFPEAEVHIDMFTMMQPLTKLRMTLTFHTGTSYFTAHLFELSQMTNTVMRVLEVGQLSGMWLRDRCKRHYLDFLKARRKKLPQSNPLDKALQQKTPR